MRLHHLQNQPGKNQGDHEEVWEAADEPVRPAAQAEGSAVAAAAIDLSPAAPTSSASISLALVVVRVIARLFIRISLHEAFLLAELEE